MTTGSLREYCRRRSWAPSYGHRQKQLGRLVMVQEGGKTMVDFEASDILLASSADPAKGHMAQVNERQRAQHRGTPLGRVPVASGNATYMQAKAMRESAEAQMAGLKLAERRGDLIRVDAVRSALATCFSSVRDRLLQIPARLSSVIAAESDPVKIRAMLEDELCASLAQLTALRLAP